MLPAEVLSEIEQQIREAVARDADSRWNDALVSVLTAFQCDAGTIHFLDREQGVLRLSAHCNIPTSVLALIESIPLGKGMAGLAAERAEPVQLCNLQTDASGIARAGAKITGMEGSLAVPMMVDARVCGVLGIAKATPHLWSPKEIEDSLSIASLIGKAHENFQRQ
jgi:L-methionine (R)-S-oxide reductase